MFSLGTEDDLERSALLWILNDSQEPTHLYVIVTI